MEYLGRVPNDHVEKLISRLSEAGFSFSSSGEDGLSGHILLSEIEHSRFLKDQGAMIKAKSKGNASPELDYLMASAELPLVFIHQEPDQSHVIDLVNERNPFLTDSPYFERIEVIYREIASSENWSDAPKK